MIIGICGYRHSGKSEIAKLLCERAFTRKPFAGPLKAMLAAVGLANEELNGSRKELPSLLLCGRTPRWAMQSIGTNWGRDLIHPDLWVTLWIASVTPMLGFPVVADDVRFPNEVAAIHELGGEVWRITRPGCESDGHESEAHVNNLDVDTEIYNRDSLAELRKTADWALARARTRSNDGPLPVSPR